MKMSEQINELADALAKAQGTIENAAKDSQNPHFKSSYADLASVREAIRKPLSENGLAYTQFVRTDNGKVQIETMLLHKSGQFMSETLEIPLMKQDAQSIGSATSYGRRYSLMAIIGIAASEDDDDGNAATAGSVQHERRALPDRQQQASNARPAEPSPAEEQINRIKAAPSIAAIDKFRSNPAVKRDFDMMSQEDQTWVNTVDQSRRVELQADNDPTAFPDESFGLPPLKSGKTNGKANGSHQYLDDDIPF